VTSDTWGIADGYETTTGEWRPTTAATRDAILTAMRARGDAAPDIDNVRVVERGASVFVDEPAELALEDGAVLPVVGNLPADVPLGYHELRLHRSRRAITLIVSPGHCHPPPPPAWGWATQVYATRSHASWGFGDFADLRRVGEWSRDLGASFLLVNPFYAAVPATPEDPSPYSPSSRRFLNPLYLRIEEIPGAAAIGPELEALASAGRALNTVRGIDREAVRRLKREALERLWRRFGGDTEFDAFVRSGRSALRHFAVYTALAETLGAGWRQWPAEYRRPDSPGVTRFAEAHADRIRFHQWVQWLLERQLDRAAREISLLHDLPIGVDANGADAWAWQDVIADGATVGAPPDRYARLGQNWGLPPFIPHRLRAAGYAPFIEMLRAAFRHGGGVRIDHVMGLFRLFWIPAGLGPAEGGYVRYPAHDLLAILALESHRAGAFVVGEDLGTVERGVREQLRAMGILSYRVLWFERAAPQDYPPLALASVATHDLPTIAGIWTGSDVAAQRSIGLDPNVAIFDELRARLATLSDVAPGGGVEDVVAGVYAALAEAPSVLLAATLEDALGVEERPNVPGTTYSPWPRPGQWPNWSLALPAPIESFVDAPLPRRIAAAFAARKRRS
jgi:4-alpha-glucanotransferase